MKRLIVETKEGAIYKDLIEEKDVDNWKPFLDFLENAGVTYTLRSGEREQFINSKKKVIDQLIKMNNGVGLHPYQESPEVHCIIEVLLNEIWELAERIEALTDCED